MSKNYNDHDGLTLTEAALELQGTGLTRNALKKRCDRNTIEYFLDSDGARRIPHHVITQMGRRDGADLPYNPYDYHPKFDVPVAEIWGDGKAPIIQLPKNKDWIKVVGVNDIHYPYHDNVLIDAVIEIATVIDPDIFVINGDTNDFFQLSRFNQAKERLELIQEEIDGGKQIRKAFRTALPNAQFEETMGNHEERLLTYPGFNAPALRYLDVMNPKKLLGLAEQEIRHWPTNGFRLKEDFLIEHGVTVRSGSGATAKARLDHTLISGVMGHTHRADSYSRTGYRELQWFETGCLCTVNPDYVRGGANWKQAFWIGDFSTKTGNFNVQIIKAVGRGFIFDGKHYGHTHVGAETWTGNTPKAEVITDFAKIVMA